MDRDGIGHGSDNVRDSAMNIGDDNGRNRQQDRDVVIDEDVAMNMIGPEPNAMGIELVNTIRNDNKYRRKCQTHILPSNLE